MLIRLWGLSLIASLLFPVSVYQASLWIEPQTGTLIKNCNYEFILKIDTNTETTNSIDSKIFLSWLNFLSGYAGRISSLSILSGIASQWSFVNTPYFYLNSYQDSPISWNNIDLAYITIQVQTWNQNTWYLDFYFLWSGVNSDDSNVSRGQNGLPQKYTSYKDILYHVEGGRYHLITGLTCETPPVIISWFYHQGTFVDSGNGYNPWGTAIKAGPAFQYPGIYPGDNNWNTLSSSTGRTIWTNTAVVLDITWDKNIHILENNLVGLPIKIGNNDPQSPHKKLFITWNISSKILYFDYSGAIGSWYKYNSGINEETGIFYIDIFWIDKTLPNITGLITYYSDHSTVTLSWDLAWISWTNKDDEYKVLNFSGIQPAPTSYLISGGNRFGLLHTIDFSWAWSGDILYMDRAGNTGSIFVDIAWTKQYQFQAYPASRLITSSTPNPNLASIYHIEVLSSTGLFVLSGSVGTNNYGTGVLKSYKELSGNYQIKIQWLAHLSTLLSGVILNEQHKLIDATSGDLTRPYGPIKDDQIKPWLSYQQIAGWNFGHNLNIFARYDSNFPIRDAYDLISANASGIQVSSGIARTGQSSILWETGIFLYQKLLKNENVTHFTLNPQFQLFSGNININQSGYFSIQTGNETISYEIPGELVKDGEINGVDSSVIIQYIRDHGATYNNNQFGLVPEDLNANGQVDAADITIHGYNLYRTSILRP